MEESHTKVSGGATVSSVNLIHGDCLDLMREMPDGSVDAVITDPPYGIGFMGNDWDHGVPGVRFWEQAIRIVKPGAHLLAFGGTRTHHRLMVAIEDAGWEIRDVVMWVYGSGFPKSHNLKGERDGWGTALKPAWEPIIVARKPLEGTVAQNVLKYGMGAMNIDACRVEGESVPINRLEEWSGFGQKVQPDYIQETNNQGRWPANLITDGSDEVLAGFPQTGCSGRVKGSVVSGKDGHGKPFEANNSRGPIPYFDSGSAARFFYCAKASKRERGDGNTHPTVKPLALMQYLIKLVTQSGDTILDPFMGSGTTGVACVNLNRNFIGIELDEKYFEIAQKRIREAGAQMIMDLREDKDNE